MQMGLPPDTPLIPDRGLTKRFKDVFDEIDDWQRDPKRELDDLPVHRRQAAQAPGHGSSTAARSWASTR